MSYSIWKLNQLLLVRNYKSLLSRDFIAFTLPHDKERFSWTYFANFTKEKSFLGRIFSEIQKSKLHRHWVSSKYLYLFLKRSYLFAFLLNQPFVPNEPFLYPCKHKKNRKDFLMFFRGWRKGAFGTNGLRQEWEIDQGKRFKKNIFLKKTLL